MRLRGLAAWALLALPTAAAAQVNPAGAWRTLTTPHFRVHYRAGLRAAADRVAGEAEWAYARLATELTPPRGAIDLVLSEDADVANGITQVSPSPRITLYLTPPAADLELRAYDDWLRVLLVHELTHVFHLDRVRGPWAALQAVFGRAPGLFPNAYQPAWVTEGIATYYESRFTGGGRVRGSVHTQLLRAAAATPGAWPRPGEATFLSPKWPSSMAPYAFGSRFFQRLAEEGPGTPRDSTVPRLAEATAGQWIPWRTGAPLRGVAGVERDSAWAALARASAPPAGEGEPGGEILERGLRAPLRPAVAHDGTLAYYAISGDDGPELVVRRPDGSVRRRLVTSVVDLAWAHDTLYATLLDRPDRHTLRSDLHRLADGRWERLTHGARLTEIAATPEGVVAAQVRTGTTALVRWTPAGLATVVEGSSGVEWASPAWGYEGGGSGALYAIRKHAGASTVLRLAAGDGPPSALPTPGGLSADLRWGAGRLLLANDATGVPSVIALDPRDGAATRLAAPPTGALEPAADSVWLYYVTLEADGFALRRRVWRDLTPEPIAPSEEPPIAAGLTPAPTFDVRDGGYRPWPALRPHYWLLDLRRRGAAGTFVGASLSGSDPVGRLGYTARAAVSPSGGRVELLALARYSRWRKATLDLFAEQVWSDAGVLPVPGSPAVLAREREASLGLTWIETGWRRSLSVRLAADLEEDAFTSEASPPVSFTRPAFAGPSLTLGFARTVGPPLAISAEDGGGAVLRLRRRWRLDRPGWSNEWRGRLTGYLALRGLGGFAHPVLAGRASGHWSAGPARETVGVGGTSGSGVSVVPGVAFGASRAFPVRGYAPSEIRGTRAASATVEVRIPVALVARPVGDLPVGVDRLSLSLFTDAGWAEGPGRPSAWIQSAGAELVWDLGVSYDIPLRLRAGLAAPLRAGPRTAAGRLGFTFAAGSDF